MKIIFIRFLLCCACLLPLNGHAQLNPLWARHFNVPPFFAPVGAPFVDPARVITDANGNVIVCASMLFFVGNDIWSGHDSIDIVTVKYDAAGTLLWSSYFHCPGDSHDLVKDMFVDTAGNIYLTGSGYNAGYQKGTLTLKLDPNGNVQWYNLETLNTLNVDEGRFIRQDANGDIVVCATVGNTGVQKVELFKYTTAGVSIGQYVIDGLSPDYYALNDFEIGPTGDYYIGATDPAYPLIRLIRCTPSGSVVFNQVCTSHMEYGLNAIDVDTAGNIYLGGSMYANSLDFYIAKLDPAGSELWYRTYSSPGLLPDEVNDVKVGPNGYVYAMGTCYQMATAQDIRVLAYDASGGLLWMDTRDSIEEDWGRKLFIDRNGDIYATAQVGIVASGEALYCKKYNPSGQSPWWALYNYNGQNDNFRDIHVDDSLYVYLTGYSFDTAADLVTIKYAQPEDPAGTTDITTASAGVLYPNPADDRIFLGSGNSADIAFYDTAGRLVATCTAQNGQISVAALAEGTYICVISEDGNVRSRQHLVIVR